MASLDNSRSRGFRIKVDLNDLLCGGLTRCWFFVESKVCKTIAELQRVLCARFHLQCTANDFEVRLQDFVIPGDESVDVLQPNDLLMLRRILPRQCSPLQNYTEEHGSIACLPGFQVPREHRSICTRCEEKRLLESPCSKIPNDDEDQMPTTSTALCSQSKTKKKKKKSKELSDAVVSPEVTKKAKKQRHTYSGSSDAKLQAQLPVKSSKSHSKKTKKSRESPDKSDSSTSQESTKKRKNTDRCAVSVVASKNTAAKRSAETSSKTPDAQETIDIMCQDVLKKKRKRHRKSKVMNKVPSDTSLCDVEDNVGSMAEDNTPRVSKTAVNFGSATSAKHFRFDEEKSPESSDSSDNLNEQVLPQKCMRIESTMSHDTRSEESPEAAQRKNVKNNVKNKSSTRALAANIPDMHKNPGVAVDAKEVHAIDYGQYPALIGHPRVKDVVAYKVLELSEDYMPKVSDYLVGEVINSDPTTTEVTIQFLTPIKTKARRGKFELLEQNIEDEIEPEEEIITSTTIEWHFVIDAKLLPNEDN